MSEVLGYPDWVFVVQDVLEWLDEPVPYLAFNWVACVVIAVELFLVWRVARWSAYRHPVTWERPMTRVWPEQERTEHYLTPGQRHTRLQNQLIESVEQRINE